jgi:D-alanine--poly(phosphoribitol) ligase subunit 1
MTLDKLVCKSLIDNKSKFALHFLNGSYTFQQVDDYSELLLEKLRSSGLTENSRLILLNSKTYDYFCIMVACLKGRITYCNVNPDISNERLKHIFSITSANLIISEKKISPFIAISVTDLVDNNRLICTPKTTSQSYVPYIMFTSGSTGLPKGVAVKEPGLIDFIAWTAKRFNITAESTLTNVNPIYFDNSVFDFYAGLAHGADLVVCNNHQLDNPIELIKYLSQFSPTIWFSVPTMIRYLMQFRQITSNNFPKLQYLIFGGEPFPKSDLKKLYEEFRDNTQLVNVYGPTECTCICSSYTIMEDDFDKMDEYCPLGDINEGFYYYILNDFNKICLQGQKGQLVIGGVAVAGGYIGQQVLTDKVFSQNHCHGDFDDRVYLTGDLVSEFNGVLYIHGRNDNQVKVNGFRIELEEVENNINTIDCVADCMAFLRKNSLDLNELGLLCVLNEKTDGSDLKIKISKILPTYMAPRTILPVNRLFKNAAGKLDRSQNIVFYVD